MGSEREFLTVVEAAHALNVSTRTIRLRIHRGSLPAHREPDTRAYLISRKYVEGVLQRVREAKPQQQQQRPSSPPPPPPSTNAA